MGKYLCIIDFVGGLEDMEYNYEELIEEFCDYKEYSDSKRKTLKRILDPIAEADLFNLKDVVGVRDLIVEKIGARTYMSLASYIATLRSFCEWGLKVKNFDVKDFLFSDELLKVKSLMYYCASNFTVPSIDEQQLEDMITTIERKSNDDIHLYYIMLLRIIYEGITIDELAVLKKNEVDMETRRIKDMNMSYKLYDSIKEYNEGFNYVDDNRSKIINIFDGSFIRDTSMYDDPNRRSTSSQYFYRRRIVYVFSRINSIVGENFTYLDIYNNGFVSLIEKRCGRDETINLFIDKYPKGTKKNQVRKKMDDLEQYGKEFRINQTGNKIRNTFYPYVISRYNL